MIQWFVKLFGIASSIEAANQAQVVSAAAACIGAAVAVAAATLVLIQVRAARLIQREAVALQLYNDYLKLCFAEPAFAGGQWKLNSSSKLSEDFLYQKYEWFVSLMLNACESILLYAAKADEWTATIKTQLNYHTEYLNSEEF